MWPPLAATTASHRTNQSMNKVLWDVVPLVHKCVTRGLPLRGLSFVLPVCRRRIISLEMFILDTLVYNDPMSHSSLNHTHRSLTVILTEPWHRRSCKHSNFQNGKLFTFVDITINDHRWFKCLIRSSQTRSWDGKLTFRNFFRNDVIVCFVRINAFHANVDVNDNKQLF